jgi:hypothetical protein
VSNEVSVERKRKAGAPDIAQDHLDTLTETGSPSSITLGEVYCKYKFHPEPDPRMGLTTVCHSRGSSLRALPPWQGRAL